MGVFERLLDTVVKRGKAALVTVVATRGSAPRDAGTRMVVDPDGAFSGTIGGGALEWQAIALAQSALANPDWRAERRSFALGPELGQCCGGRVDLVVETFEQSDRDVLSTLADHEKDGLLTTVGRFVGRGSLDRTIAQNGAVGFGGVEAGQIRETFGEARRHVALYGAGHVGKALVLAMAPLPFSVTWYDPRPDVFPSHVPMNVDPRHLENPGGSVAATPAGSFVLVMTHSHQLDLAIVEAALAADRFPYIGLIGSATKRARFEKRLAEAGLSQDRRDALVCPIGIEGVQSKAPAIIAAATAAELLIRDEALRALAEPVMPASQSVAGA